MKKKRSSVTVEKLVETTANTKRTIEQLLSLFDEIISRVKYLDFYDETILTALEEVEALLLDKRQHLTDLMEKKKKPHVHK